MLNHENHEYFAPQKLRYFNRPGLEASMMLASIPGRWERRTIQGAGVEASIAVARSLSDIN